MPALSNKRLHFLDSSDETGTSVFIDSSCAYELPKASKAAGGEWVLPLRHQRVKKNAWSYCRRSEAVIGVVIAIAGHLAWLAVSPMPGQAVVKTPPKPIRVEWIAAPRPHVEAPPKPDAEKRSEAKKPLIKPKPKVSKPVVIKRKPILSTAAATPVTQTRETTKEERQTTPVAESLAPAPAATTAPDHAKAEALPTMPPNLSADYLDNPAPAYPPISREQGEQGKVLLRAMINADGSVARLELRKTSGFERLDKAALETVKQWRFVPARRGEQAVSAWVVVPVSFTLEG